MKKLFIMFFALLSFSAFAQYPSINIGANSNRIPGIPERAIEKARDEFSKSKPYGELLEQIKELSLVCDKKLRSHHKGYLTFLAKVNCHHKDKEKEKYKLVIEYVALEPYSDTYYVLRADLKDK